MSINEIIEFIKSNPEIEINYSVYHRMDGYFQLTSDVESESIKHSELGDDYNGEILTVETDKEGNQIVEFHPEFKERGISHITGEPIDDFFPNLKKHIYQDYYNEWEEGIIENESFLEHLNEFIEEDEENGNESLEYYLDAVKESEGTRIDEGAWDWSDEGIKGGVGRDVGVDEFSWFFSDYTKDGDFDISGHLNNKKVF